MLFTTVDRTPFTKSPFYHKTLNNIDSVGKILVQLPNDSVTVAWAENNIVPENPVRLTGNHWDPYESVYDSIFVRSFLFANQYQKILLLNYDLWIMHPHLANKIKKRIFAANLGINEIYFTASHSHSSIGGWASGILGNMVVGGNNDATLSFIIDQTEGAVIKANANLQPGQFGYQQFDTQSMVENRLDKINGKVDSWIRVLKIRNEVGDQVFFNTFSAHPVFMDKHMNVVSADYPGSFVKELTAVDSVTMASFAAGAMGNHSPVRHGPFQYQGLIDYGIKLADVVIKREDEIHMTAVTTLKFAQIPINLRSPHFRISNNIRVRPWLFKLALGEHPSFISILQLGNTVLLGLPVELSGEYYAELETYYKAKGLSLMVTTFNGNYLGYVNPKKYYDKIRKAETRDMNWYGPENGEYFVALIKEIATIL